MRNTGCDVRWVAEDSAAARDEDVLARAPGESRVLLTFDKDFGELAFRKGLAASCGVVLFRVDPSLDSLITETILGRDDWVEHFSVVTSQRVRMTRVTGARKE